jgi:hypothetical protein
MSPSAVVATGLSPDERFDEVISASNGFAARRLPDAGLERGD